MIEYITACSLQAAEEKLISAHDGAMALLYIHIDHTGCYDREKAAEDLCMTLNEICASEEKLLRAGLIRPLNSSSANDPKENSSDAVSVRKEKSHPVPDHPSSSDFSGNVSLFPDSDLPQYTVEDVLELASKDPAFSAVLQEVRSVLGQDMNSNDLKRFCSVYHSLGLPPEVIYVLLHFCSEISAGNSRKLTVGFIEKNAYSWARDGITTVDLAEKYCDHYRETKSSIGKIKTALGINEKLTDSQEKYIRSWIENGFDETAVYEAYDRAVTKKDTRSFAYINGILKNWHENGIHSLEEIRSFDSRSAPGRKSPKAGSSGSKPVPVDITDVENILNIISGNK